MKSKIKWAALGGLVLSFMSLLAHLFLAKSSASMLQYSSIAAFTEDLNYPEKPGSKGAGYRKLWGKVKAMEVLQPYANTRSMPYPGNFPYMFLLGIATSLTVFQSLITNMSPLTDNHVLSAFVSQFPHEQNNGFIYAKVHGDFEKIKASICDLVAISRLLNATLVIPEIQGSTQSKGISSKFRSFSYLYNEEQFISVLANDVIIARNLPHDLMETRERKQYPIFKPKRLSSPNYYLQDVLPKLKSAKVIGLILTDGGCLESILPSSLVEYQRLRCRVAYHALHFREEIVEVGNQIVQRLRGSGQPYLAYYPGLRRDILAYHGCAELFQDVHTELLQFRRKQMIKQGLIKEESVDSRSLKANGSCPLMPEEVGLLLRALGYPPRTRIYLAGSETFGGQRVLIPLRAMYTNLVDRTSLCSKQELAKIIGPETPFPLDSFEFPPAQSAKQLKKEWDNAGPRPRPLPPPPDRSIYRHEKEGWYGWIAEKDSEPEPSSNDLRNQAHRLLWDAVDYIVSVEADAFFPGFDNDGSGWPDFSGLIMGHRLYKMASSRTYRPDRKYLTELINSTRDNLYHPRFNWTVSIREHLNKSTAEDGIMREFLLSRPTSFLSHPIPECSCATLKNTEIVHSRKGSNLQILYQGQDECPKGLDQGLNSIESQDDSADESEMPEDDVDLGPLESDQNSQPVTVLTLEQDEEMDPDD